MKTRRRPGRKPKPDQQRHPSGKIVQKPEDARETAIQARMRLFNMSREDAVRQEAGTAIGRALDNRDITRDQYEACLEFLVRRDAYDRAMLVPKVRSASDFDGVRGHDGSDGTDEQYVEQCNRARRRYADIRRWVMDADAFGLMALETWVLEDKEAMRLVGSLRIAANAIHRLLRLEKAAA